MVAKGNGRKRRIGIDSEIAGIIILVNGCLVNVDESTFYRDCWMGLPCDK